MGNQNQQPWPETDTIAVDVERYSALSSEMVALLERLTRDINRSAQELRDIRAAVDAGKKELAALRESEREVSVLEQQLDDLRLQKAGLESLIADQRIAWEEEKEKQVLEEKEREENLKTRRQRSAEIRTTEETDILARESALKKKEQELSRLMLELEKFLSGLTGRKGTAAADLGVSRPDSRLQIS